jgi:hypothetical protein
MIWISHPLGYYGLLAVGLCLCLYLFISVKKENAQLQQKLETERQQSQDMFGEFRKELGNLAHSLHEHEKFEETLTPVRTAPGLSINLTRRSQALRMYRRGDSPEQIAAALQMPRNEVELLLKVQRALAEQSS